LAKSNRFVAVPNLFRLDERRDRLAHRSTMSQDRQELNYDAASHARNACSRGNTGDPNAAIDLETTTARGSVARCSCF
jgi:hypothetical protein